MQMRPGFIVFKDGCYLTHRWYITRDQAFKAAEKYVQDGGVIKWLW